MVITRFAPSPTGNLHIGGARTALFCWAFARRTGGHFMIRVEDTDQARSSESSARGILSDLAWLGIDWDEGPTLDYHGRRIGGDPRKVGPFFQSQRLHLYNEVVERLIEIGRAYPAFETSEELEAKRKAAVAAKRTYRYDRAALEVPAAERVRRMKAGEPHVVRFLMPDAGVQVRDDVLGDVAYAPGEVDDFVIRKADGFPTYHFAVVVDDELMGVTHILRGQEHLNNTPRHVALQDALGYRRPKYAHMPLIFNEQGAKMSKRERDQAAREACKKAGLTASPVAEISDTDFAAWLGDKTKQLDATQLAPLAQRLTLTLPEVSVEDFRSAGYLPGVITNFIALLGWSPGHDLEKFDMNFLARNFDLERIGKTNARFDRKKLLSFNTDAVTATSDGEFARLLEQWCAMYRPELPASLGPQRFAMLCAALRPRSRTLADAAAGAAFALQRADQIIFDPKAVEKVLKKDDGAGLKALKLARAALAGLDPFEPAGIHSALERTATDHSLNIGAVAQPIRVAVTGSTVSPPIDATLAVLGKIETLARIDRCLAAHGA